MPAKAYGWRSSLAALLAGQGWIGQNAYALWLGASMPLRFASDGHRGGKEMPSRVFQGVLYAAFLALAGVAWRLVWVRYAEDTIQQAVTEDAKRQQAAQHRRLEQLTAQAKHMTAAAPGRVLASNERCIGGSIVRVETVNGVPTYTQVSDGARPMMCRHADPCGTMAETMGVEDWRSCESMGCCRLSCLFNFT